MKNRTIKFRVWTREGMVSPDYVNRDGIGWWKENSIPQCSGLLMQGTGMPADDGTEMYEGDVITFKFREYGHKVHKGVIEYQNETAEYIARMDRDFMPLGSCDFIKIIGHVYEESPA
jgi:hypothetical protein